MKHFAHSLGEYLSWKGDEGKRAAFVEQLLRVIKHGVHKAFLVSLQPSSLAAICRNYNMSDREFENPYHVCASHCIEAVDKWMAAKYPAGRYTHVIEKGDSGQSETNLAKSTQQALTTSPKKNTRGDVVRPFEAADLIAYEAKRAHDRTGDQKVRPFRKSYERLTNLVPLETHWLEPQDLKQAVTEMPDIFRPK